MYWTFSYFIVMMWEKWDHFKSPMETNAQSPSNITMISFCILFAVARHSNNQHWVNIFNAISKACTAYCPHATSQIVLIYYLWHYLHVLKILKIMYVCSMRFAVFFLRFSILRPSKWGQHFYSWWIVLYPCSIRCKCLVNLKCLDVPWLDCNGLIFTSFCCT